MLALGSEDKTFSINSEDGDTMRIVQVRDIPTDIVFAEMKHDDGAGAGGQNTVSMILGKRTLYFHYMPEPDSPTELGFQPKYGQILQHKWFGDGLILLGFSNGHLVVISTNPKDVGQELWQVKNHRDNLAAIALSNEVDMVASCGDNCIKMHSTKNLQETTKILTLPDQAKNLAWSSDGQLLAVSTQQGAISVFVTQMQTMCSISAPRVALMTNLTEVTLFHYSPAEKVKQLPNLISLEIEPTFIALGACHFACGMNNHVWFYDLGRLVTDIPIALGDREYMSEINAVAMNGDFCAAHCGGQIILHAIDSSASQDPIIFPDEIVGMQENVIICMALTNYFLCFATDLGNIVHFSLEQWAVVVKYRHEMGVKQIFPDLDGNKLIILDEQSQGFVYLPTTEEVIKIPELSKSTTVAIWDLLQPNVFITFDDSSKSLTTFVYIPISIKGRYIQKIGQTKLLSDQLPLMLYDGDVCINSGGSRVNSITLSTHKNNPSMSLEEQMEVNLNLRRWSSCWDLCKTMNRAEQWEKLGKMAISDTDIQFAIKIYRQIEEAAMVLALEEIQYVEDSNLLMGHCALLLDDMETAKNFFARSFNPKEALNLCRDLLQWEQALALAATLAPDQVAFIAREYAQQLEFSGNYSEALMHYEKARRIGQDDPKMETHQKLCKMGIARTSIWNGSYRQGIEMAVELNEKKIYQECGEALIATNHISEAAAMMEKAENWDRAAQLYIQLKQWNRVDQILSQVTSLKLHGQYAAAKESEGRYNEAIHSYRMANDMDSVVRILIDHLNDPHSASEIVLETRSVEGSKLLASFYQGIGDYESAIQFLILCGCTSNAFELAQKYNKIRQYGEALEQYDGAKPADFNVLAQHFEQEKYTLLTGKYYFLAKEYSKALKHLLKASSFNHNDESSALSLAIDCVATANDERLVNQLIQFLLGENDGVPKDPKLLFRLYMARKQFREAAKTAVIIANQEQVAGNYRVARDLLFSMYQELKRNGLGIATDMRNSLNLLHRYTLVRLHIKMENHKLAAGLLVEIANNISQFPSHIVPILTSAVIECQRAGLKQAAYKNAVTLMRPEYRSSIDAKYSKKIESIVRKAPRGIKDLEDELQQETSPCPSCDYELQKMETICSKCRDPIPICVATGQHLVKSGVAVCPDCEFPAIRNDLIK